MTEKLANFFISLFGVGVFSLKAKYIIIFLISMIPILELRGGLIIASFFQLPMWQSFLICFLGNLVPIPIILWFITPIFDRLKKIKFFQKMINGLESKADSKKAQIENLKYLGLFLFVGIPLPGTGAWTGCLIAALLNMDKKKSLIAAILGVIMAGIIMLVFSYGLLGSLIN